jgi:hypothetical protein
MFLVRRPAFVRLQHVAKSAVGVLGVSIDALVHQEGRQRAMQQRQDLGILGVVAAAEVDRNLVNPALDGVDQQRPNGARCAKCHPPVMGGATLATSGNSA